MGRGERLTEVVIAVGQVDGVLEADASRERREDAEAQNEADCHSCVAIHLDGA